MDLTVTPPWSRKRLRRLGEAMAAGETTPADCPDYSEVLLWHSDLAAEVAAVLAVTSWAAFDADKFDLAARAKTHDTLVEKLRRSAPRLTLDQVQDLAGVRVDADFTLDEQLALAEEVAAHFGEDSIVKDIRDNPHSGYRAVHVWLRLPVGRAEVQLRTLPQSAWANTYERLADIYGRGIRYGKPAENPGANKLVEALQALSGDIADMERLQLQLVGARERANASLARDPTSENRQEIDRKLTEVAREVDEAMYRYVDLLTNIKRTLDSKDE